MEDAAGVYLFSTYFPTLPELMMVHSIGIKNIYFFGDITDPRCVKYFNEHSAYCEKTNNNELKFNIVKLS